MPDAGEDISFVTTASITLVGRTRVDASVTVALEFVTVGREFLDVDEDGLFSSDLALEEGPNTIEVLASVDTGEVSTVLVVSYEPEE